MVFIAYLVLSVLTKPFKCSVTALSVSIQVVLYTLYTWFYYGSGWSLLFNGKLVDFPDYDDPFNAHHAEQVPRALSDIATDMWAVTGAWSHEHLIPDNLNKRTATKERLCQWLGAFSYMMSRFAYPHLQMAVEHLDKIRTNYWKKRI